MFFKSRRKISEWSQMISERTDKYMHKPEGTQELQFDECSRLDNVCTNEVGYVYCAPKYVFMNF